MRIIERIIYWRLPITLLMLIIAFALYPSNAEAHIVTRAHCMKYAKARIQNMQSPKLQDWQQAFRSCRAWAKRHNRKHLCNRRYRPLIPYGITVKHRVATINQRRNLTTALDLARRMRSPHNHQVALVAAMTQEASARNLPYGHGTSVGILQLIDIHGSFAWRMRITNSAGWFLRGAHRIDPRGHLYAPRLAQRVQRSAYPTAYARWRREAENTVRRYHRFCHR